MPAEQEPIPLPRLESPHEMSLLDVQKSFQSSPKLPFGQNWYGKTERDFQPGTVMASWCPDYLHIFADFEDEDIVLAEGSSLASSLIVADIFQVFIDRPLHGDYLELHVTPDNHSRALAWTPERLNQFREGEISLDDILIDNDQSLLSDTWIEQDEGSWHAYLRVPISLIDSSSPHFQGDLSVRGTFCRFDASPDSPAPVLSSTSPFQSGPKFHEREDWHNLLLQES